MIGVNQGALKITSQKSTLLQGSMWYSGIKEVCFNRNQSINQSVLLRMNYINTSHREKNTSYLERVHIDMYTINFSSAATRET